ncbi:MAG: ligase-associated DNA damage response DEXH box helicase [Comamonadaceae bacterium]|nr:MAG: ligase-associated DNA damage response DEXH box helicase [Comamonadaceae bacterium]
MAPRVPIALKAWLDARGWKAFPFQAEVWDAIAHGRGGMLHATTGAGKTYAVWLGLLLRFAVKRAKKVAKPTTRPTARKPVAPPLTVLWITPMRALAADSMRALQQPLAALAPDWTLGMRTGDTASSERARQDRRWPTALLTTPESLSLMLSRNHAREELATVQAVVVDEWHELMGNKRGVQLQLALARLRQMNPQLMTWGMSATLGNLEQAMDVLQGAGMSPLETAEPVLVQGKTDKTLIIDTLIPYDPGKYSWAGHLGKRMQQAVVDQIEVSGPTLVFTNTRSQAEIWYQLLLTAKPEWAGEIALHHGSLDKDVREWVEMDLKEGKLRAVVATSSLDLGVDFLPVERVLQIGSAKGVARLLQRAGRSGHAPGRASRVTLVPTNTLELLEAAAARNAAKAGRIEKRTVPDKPLDVLVQHMVTLALGGGFIADALYAEVRRAWSYRDLTQEEFDWALAFCERGGTSLTAYPDYHRIALDDEGVYRVPDAGIARRHRLNIGTIVGDASLQVSYLRGARIGTIEESFIARLRKGDCFVFAGRLLEFIRVQDMTAYVKKAEKNKGAIPSWNGGKMPLSTEMADAVLDLMQRASDGDFREPELEAARPMLQTQLLLSALPVPGMLLVETFKSREGHHLFVYPFAGRHVHMGLANLLAWRLARDAPNTFSISVNDYGFELLSAREFDLAQVLDTAGSSVFSTENLLEDMLASLNSSELARRRFREIARVAGLIFTGYPGASKSTKQLQASSSLFFEVFRKYDSSNLLLTQADREVLVQELELARLAGSLGRIGDWTLTWKALKHPSPMCLPLMVERFREKLSTEQLSARLDRIIQDMEKIESAEEPHKTHRMDKTDKMGRAG